MKKLALHQIVPIEDTAKKTYQSTLTEVHRIKPDEFDGVIKTYSPLSEEGETFPPEEKKVQKTVTNEIQDLKPVFVNYMNLLTTKEVGNQSAKADIVIGDTSLAQNIPAVVLIQFEKKIQDLITVVSGLPVLSPAYHWTFNQQHGLYETNEINRHRTIKKVNHKTVPVGEGFAHQVVEVTEDITVGTWTQKGLSGAIPATEKKEILDRLNMVLSAVKIAREEANKVEVEIEDHFSAVFDFIFQTQ